MRFHPTLIFPINPGAIEIDPDPNDIHPSVSLHAYPEREGLSGINTTPEAYVSSWFIFIHPAFSLHAYPERYHDSRILAHEAGGVIVTGHAPTSEKVAHPVVCDQNIPVKYITEVAEAPIT